MAFFLVSGEEEGVEVVEKLVGVDLRRPPTMLWRGRGPSMVGGMVDLLHGLEIERERVRKGNEGEREGRGWPGRCRARADTWVQRGIRGSNVMCI